MKTKYLELIHKEIDGIITPAEKKKLENAARKDPDLTRLQKELRNTAEILKQVPVMEPSPNLKKKIIHAIDFSRYSPRSEGDDWLSKITNWITTPRLRLAYAVGAGMVMGIVISLLLIGNPFSNQPIPISELYGTIGINENNFQTLKELTIDLEGIQGAIVLNSFQDMVWFEVNIETNQSSEIQFTYDEQLISFIGLRPIAWGKTVMETNQNMVKLLCDRQCHGLVLFHKSSENFYPLTLSLVQSERVIFTQQFLKGE